MKITFVVTVRNTETGRTSPVRVDSTFEEVSADEQGTKDRAGQVAVEDFTRRKGGSYEVESVEKARF